MAFRIPTPACRSLDFCVVRPDFRWYREGADTRARLEKTDPTAGYSYISLYIDNEPLDQGYLRQIDAITFSHPLLLTYDQVDATYRDGLPSEWLALEIDA